MFRAPSSCRPRCRVPAWAPAVCATLLGTLLGTAAVAQADEPGAAQPDAQAGVPTLAVAPLTDSMAWQQRVAERRAVARERAGIVLPWSVQRFEQAPVTGAGWAPGPWSHAGAARQVSLGVVVVDAPALGHSRIQLGWQSPVLGTEARRLQGDAPAPQPPTALHLRSADPLADLRLGTLMKVNFDRQTTLSLRPRKGGLRLYLQSQW